MSEPYDKARKQADALVKNYFDGYNHAIEDAAKVAEIRWYDDIATAIRKLKKESHDHR